MATEPSAQYQILVRLLDGRTRCLRFSAPTLPASALLDAVAALSGVPPAALRLVTGRLSLAASSVLAASPDDGQFPSAHALLRLRGGKGGFGSLLRGAASKAGQKKTSNFDACRDINGRRLRHVNAERRLEEWKAEAGDRQLEKLAEDFLKKKAKESGRGGVRAAEVDKYLEKYRKDAESCVNAVEESVRASLGKRKAVPKPRDAKKLKIWMGKKKVVDEESDSGSDSDVDDDEDADTKPVALDDGNCSNGSNKSEDEKVDLASVSGSHSEGESSGEKSQSIDSEKDGDALQESMELAIKSGCDVESGSNLECEGGMLVQPPPENTSENGSSENGISALSEEILKSDEKTDVDNTGSATSLLNDPEVPPVEEFADVDNKSLISEEPVDLTTFISAADLEVLGMEKLKLELQTRGLKCGGTLGTYHVKMEQILQICKCLSLSSDQGRTEPPFFSSSQLSIPHLKSSRRAHGDGALAVLVQHAPAHQLDPRSDAARRLISPPSCAARLSLDAHKNRGRGRASACQLGALPHCQGAPQVSPVHPRAE